MDGLCSGGFQSKKSKIIGSLAGIRTLTTTGEYFSSPMLYHWAIEASNWMEQNLDFKSIYAWIYTFFINFQKNAKNAFTRIDIAIFPL